VKKKLKDGEDGEDEDGMEMKWKREKKRVGVLLVVVGGFPQFLGEVEMNQVYGQVHFKRQREGKSLLREAS
jgi:hypothetical protein